MLVVVYRTSDGQRVYTKREAEEIFGGWFALFGLILGGLLSAAMYIIAGALDPVSSELSPGMAYGVTEARLTPPVEFTGGVEVRVRFTTPEEVVTLCNNSRAAACWDPQNARIITPNPCYDGWQDSFWADHRANLCHELAHVNGWMHGEWQDPDVVAKVEDLRQ